MGLATVLLALLLWMVAAAWTGFTRQYGRFLILLLAGPALNAVWMVFVLGAKPFAGPALAGQVAALLYATCAFACGWFASRVRRAWRDSRVE